MAATRLTKNDRYMGLTEKHDGVWCWTGEVRCHSDLLDAPLHWGKPRQVFVCSMSDLFHEKVPGKFINRVMSTVVQAPQHTFQVLTKRVERMARYFDYAYHTEAGGDEIEGDWDVPISNLWLGVSVSTRDEWWKVDVVRDIPAAVHFISIEPMLEDMFPISLDPYLDGIQWVICGAESGPNRRP